MSSLRFAIHPFRNARVCTTMLAFTKHLPAKYLIFFSPPATAPLLRILSEVSVVLQELSAIY